MGIGRISDHHPIYLEVGDTTHRIKAPFKFNSTWLRDPAYIRLVTKFWQAHPIRNDEDSAKGFVHNLRELKSNSKDWAHMKRKQEDNTLSEAEQAITSLEANIDGTYTS